MAVESETEVASGRRHRLDNNGALREARRTRKLLQPTFVTDYPEEISPLARRNPDMPGFTERFEILIAGQEIANAFSELIDPLDQRCALRSAGGKEGRGRRRGFTLDEDFLTRSSTACRPRAGSAWASTGSPCSPPGSQNIKDVIIFPHLRPQGRSTHPGVE